MEANKIQAEKVVVESSQEHLCTGLSAVSKEKGRSSSSSNGLAKALSMLSSSPPIEETSFTILDLLNTPGNLVYRIEP